MIPESRLLTRRQALAGIVGVAGGLVLIGCGDQTTLSPTTTAPDSLTLGARFADGFQAPTVIAAGSPQRAPYVLIGADGWPATDVPDRIEMTVTQGDTVVHTGTVDRHGEDHVIPYFPLVFTPPTAACPAGTDYEWQRRVNSTWGRWATRWCPWTPRQSPTRST